MRKIYSLVLMTAMLFVGTNAWANPTVRTVGTSSATYSTIQAAINAAVSGDTVRLTTPMTITPQTPVWLGTEAENGTAKSIVLDLAGNNITSAPTKASHTIFMFAISHGEMKIMNSDRTKVAEIKLIASENPSYTLNRGSNIFTVYGTYRQDSINTRTSGYYTHLEIADNIKLSAGTGTGIAVDVANDANAFKEVFTHANKSTIYNITGTTYSYLTNVFAGSYGFAFGVRVDMYGEIVIDGINTKSYGIKSNGYLETPFTTKTKQNSSKSYHSYLSTYVFTPHDTICAPFIYVHSTAKLQSNANIQESAACYCSGYAKWLIEGECKGNIGVSVSSGNIDIDGATITSTASTYTPPTGGGSVSGSGSGIVVNSRDGYAGNVDVTISGDATITSSAGYAIEETVTTTSTESKTESIVITGGNIIGGDSGSIAVSTKVGDDYVTTVYSGNISGNVSGDEGTTLQDLLPTGEGSVEVHTTVVYDENGENPVTVISEGAAPTGDANVAEGHDENSSVKWTGTSETISANLSLKELEINEVDGSNDPIAQTLTIGNGTDDIVVTVGKIVLGTKAKIIVNAGCKLIVTGSQGMYSTVNDNLVLRATASKQATFVIGPNVATNKQPKATVEFVSSCYYDGAHYVWHRFAAPIEITGAPEKSASVSTYAKYISNVGGGSTWENIGAWTDIKPFMAASITNTSNTAGVVYTFKGKLMGNVTDALQRKASTWNHYGNSFMAPIGIEAFLNALPGQDMDKTIYYWDINAGNFLPMNEGLAEFGEGISELKAMQFFVCRNKTQEVGALDIDYTNSIFNYNVNGGSSAPKRIASYNANRVRINITAENGEKDVVYLLGSDRYSANYEDGYDAEKLMNEGMNLYVAGDMNLSMLYTNDIQGTLLTLQTGEDINYTMTFGKVNGEVYALRDNLTNAVVLMNEDATYNFTAQPNATLDGRFQIVSRQEMPTAVETIEETVAPKAIYTIMGQYVGETTDWNNLPAGVYVVDGVKVIK